MKIIALILICHFAAAQDTVRCIIPLDIRPTEWAAMPTKDRVYYQSLILQNAHFDFYTNLRFYVQMSGNRELSRKARMTEKNFIKHLNGGTFTPNQIRLMMAQFVQRYPQNMYGIDLSNEEERVLN